jgi:hypothetical protein
MEYFSETTTVDDLGNACVVTLPIPTVDGRVVGVFIEPRMADYFLVNDGGKAVNELILQGLRITESIESYLSSLARNFGVIYQDEMFQAGCRKSEIQRTIISVGACSSLAMAQLISHIQTAIEEPSKDQFGRALRSWARKKVKITSDVPLPGKRAQHKFDFMATLKSGAREPIVLSVLYPGSNSLASSQRFGFKTSDLEATPYQKWGKVAIEDRSEQWSAEAKNIVRNCADIVIEIPTGTKIDRGFVAENMRLLVA